MDLLKRFEDRAPEYAKMYREQIINQFAYVGGGDEETKFQTAKRFSNVYEIYMYAAMLGLKKNYRLPLEGVETQKFIEIRSWNPSELRRFIFMGLLAQAEIDLNAMEDMEESEVEKELTRLKGLLEEYANGGFDLISGKMKEDTGFFDDEYCFIELLGEFV